MATLPEADTWPLDVYQIDVTDPVLGGPDGPPNRASGALAKRAAYQRLRNVTTWDVDLATKFDGYPDKACVMYGGLSWRSKVNGNTAVPGSDPLKWERWGFSESELGDILSALSISISGPQELTDAQREQAQLNIALPREWMEVLNGTSVNVPPTSTFVTLPLTGGTESSTGDLVSVGNEIEIARAGLYVISGTCYLITNTAGIPALTLAAKINGVASDMLRVSVQDKTSSPGAGQGYTVTFSGPARLEVGDLVSFAAYQNVGAGISLTCTLAGGSVTRLSV